LGVGELDLPRVGHGGVAIAAVGHDDEAVGAGLELEGGVAEIGVGRGLVDLFHLGAGGVVEGEVEAGAGVGGGGAGDVGEGGLLKLENGEGEVGGGGGGGGGGGVVSEVGGFAGGEQKNEK